MKISEYALSFIREYKITDITRNTLEDIIEQFGYNLVKYNTMANDDETEEIIQKLGLERIAKQKQCFTYKSEALKIIFIRDNIGNMDSIPILLHEIGHIYMDHIENGLVENDVRYENAANKFSVLVSGIVEKQTKRKKVAYILTWTIMFVFTAIFVIVCIKTVYKINSDRNNQSVTISNSLVTTITTTTTKTTTTKLTSTKKSNKNIFYVTDSGKKYHKEWCSIIKNRTNVYYGIRKNLEDMGYEPCQLCCGDE